jgi:predicted RNase H-like nuclease
MIAGVDGCKRGWLCLSLVDTDRIQADIYSSAAELMVKALACEILAIDIPIRRRRQARLCDHFRRLTSRPDATRPKPPVVAWDDRTPL